MVASRYKIAGGNCLSHTGPLGAVERYTYDKLNLLIKANLSDGNEVTLAYNAYEDVVSAKDKYFEIVFTYDILGNIVSRVEGERKLQYRYNNQGHLMSILNEKGEAFQRKIYSIFLRQAVPCDSCGLSG